MSRRLKVLVADDEPLSRRLITAALSKEFELHEATDGEAAVQAFTQFHPDAVLLDVDMPRLDGVDTARELKRLAGTRFVPVFLISGLEEQATLIRGLSAGADDFLPKPVNASVFRPKLDVFLRLQDMQQKLVQQNTELEAYRRETQAEHTIATQVFERMMTRGGLSDPRVCVALSPLSIFNGDTVMANVTPSGDFRLLLGDGTGHGLAAALGTLPLGAIFHGSTLGGDALAQTATRLNLELKSLLPAQLFCTAVIFELNATRDRLSVVNAGMPELIVPGRTRFASKNVPLGIDRQWVPTVEHATVGPGDRVYAMSDGIIEATNAAGELFGATRVLEVLDRVAPEARFARLLEAVRGFGVDQSDDVSLVEVKV